MSLNECIINANNEGIIGDAKKTELQENFKEFEKILLHKVCPKLMLKEKLVVQHTMH